MKNEHSRKRTYLEEEHPEDILARGPDTPKEDSRMDGCEQRAVQPSPSLRNELGNLFREM